MKPARGPQPKDIYQAQLWEMAGAHAFLMNALLHVYEQAPTIPKEKQKDFVEYCLQWVAALDHHHHWEETIYYPLYSPKFNTDAIVAEHESFHAGVEALKAYLVSCLPAGTSWGYGETVPKDGHSQQVFDADKFRELVDNFVNELSTHLKQELGYLDPAKVRASGLTEKEMEHIASVSEKHMKSMPPHTFLTYVVIHTPKGSDFPPIPGPVRSVLVPYVFYWPNRRLWQFAPKR